jgi:hypothetical protein
VLITKLHKRINLLICNASHPSLVSPAFGEQRLDLPPAIFVAFYPGQDGCFADVCPGREGNFPFLADQLPQYSLFLSPVLVEVFFHQRKDHPEAEHGDFFFLLSVHFFSSMSEMFSHSRLNGRFFTVSAKHR